MLQYFNLAHFMQTTKLQLLHLTQINPSKDIQAYFSQHAM